MTTRLSLGAVGVAVGLYGAFLMLTRASTDGLVNAGVWLAAGVLLHDVALSALVLLAGLVVTRLLPSPVRAPAAVALVVVGTLTVVAVPVLGRFGAREDNATLLDRPYLGSWLILLAVAALAVAVAGVVRSRRGAGVRPAPGTGAGAGPQD